MRNSKSKVRCEKRKLPKCDDLLRLYSPMQSRYADLLQADQSVKSFLCNIPLDPCDAGEGFTTDFYIMKADDTIMVRECVFRKHLSKPMTIKLLTASFCYWSERGVKDWGLVVDSAGNSSNKKGGEKDEDQ